MNEKKYFTFLASFSAGRVDECGSYPQHTLQDSCVRGWNDNQDIREHCSHLSVEKLILTSEPGYIGSR